MLEQIKNHINNIHGDDLSQLTVIFSDKKQLIVEAPAGYGKTKTMISKIAYLIANNDIPHPKKVLALTFSINAAYKIKKDITQNLPILLQTSPISPYEIKNKVVTTNYHGFCRNILRLYGYLFDPNLKNIQTLTNIDDDNITNIDIALNFKDVELFQGLNSAVKQIDVNYLQKNTPEYIKKVKEILLPNNYITYNSIILLTMQLFEKYPIIKDFYIKYFPIIFIDEFQDTNYLSWSLLQELISNQNKVTLMGDSLQRIYGFIGAIPDLMKLAQEKFEMDKLELLENHRFKDNIQLLHLDKIVREMAKNINNPNSYDKVTVSVIESRTQNDEAIAITNLIKRLQNDDPSSTIAVLVKQRGKNIDKILDVFQNQIDYFYALYSDEDEKYLRFHRKAANLFVETIKASNGKINKNICNQFYKKVSEFYQNDDSKIINSLLQLLRTFLDKALDEFKFLTIDDKIELIKDTLESNVLKQYLGYVDSKIIVSTIHGAKGLEWDYVILPDMERDTFPGWYALCGKCDYRHNCNIEWGNLVKNFENKFYEELSVFYVAVTRAKKKLYFSYSLFGIDSKDRIRENKMNCFLRIPAIQLNIEK